MRRLTLILSDLYVPEEAASVIPTAIDLPGLAWLLRFARPPVSCPDWRAWLAAQIGQAALAQEPLARLAARAFVEPGFTADAWIATPVHLEARLDHVRLVDRGLLRVGADEGRRWSEAFAREFGPEVKLHPAGERGFLLTGLEGTDAQTVDPARLLDSDVAPSLPRGANAGGLRRLGAELEMWLHATPLNEERHRAGHPRISAFWFWGGRPGALALAVVTPPASFMLHGGDVWFAGLARATRAMSSDPPLQFAALDPAVDHHIVELSPMTDPRHSLADAEANWFLPARAALSEGNLVSVDIVVNDRWFRIGARAGWRWWSKRRGWLDSLNRRPASKA